MRNKAPWENLLRVNRLDSNSVPLKDLCLFFLGIFMGLFPYLTLLTASSFKEQPRWLCLLSNNPHVG